LHRASEKPVSKFAFQTQPAHYMSVHYRNCEQKDWGAVQAAGLYKSNAVLSLSSHSLKVAWFQPLIEPIK
jgi:hypothetical protein